MPVDKKHLLVTIDDDALNDMPSVVARLKKAGLTKVKAMESIGIVSGDAAESKVAALGKVRGVRAVEEDARIQLPEPGDPIQ